MTIRRLQKEIAPVTLLFAFLLSLFFILSTSFVYAADVTPEYKPLIGIPGLTDLNEDTTLPDYINQIYFLTIIVGAVLGVMRLAWAGVKYSLSDVVTEKSGAKHDMTGVLMGLAILLIPFVVLKEINPNLVNLDVFHEAENFEISGYTQETGPGSRVCSTPDCSENRPTRFLPNSAGETNDYIACRRSGRLYNTVNNKCTDEKQTVTLRNPCTRWGGKPDLNNGVIKDREPECIPGEMTAVETYREVDADAAGDGLKRSWEKECMRRGSLLKIMSDDESDVDLVTYACFKE